MKFSNSNIAITIYGKDVAPRFDLTREVLFVKLDEKVNIFNTRIVLLPHTGAEELCGFLIRENVKCIICGAIEEIHYDYMKWKKINIIDNVIGSYEKALELFINGKLTPGTIIV